MKAQPIKEITTKGKTLKIFIDDDSDDPRTWDNLAKMIFTGRKWGDLGDKHTVNFDRGFNSRESFIIEGEQIVRKHFKGDVAIIKAVHLYDHSGVSISTKMEYPFNDHWDSGTIGFAVILKSDIRKEYGVKRITKKELDKAESILEGEIQTLNTYITGDIYRFVIEDENGDMLDSCGGFFGSDFATNGITDHISEDLKEVLINA